MELDDNLKQLMKDLGSAINDALSESAEISDAIQNVRESGFDVYLVLEATIGVSKRPAEQEQGAGSSVAPGDVRLEVNAQDMKFLKSLKIKIDDLD